MGFHDFTRASFWSSLFNVLAALWYVLAVVIIFSIFNDKPWELVQRPGDLQQWTMGGKLGFAIAAYYWIWAPILLLAAPWLFLQVANLVRFTVESIIPNSLGGRGPFTRKQITKDIALLVEDKFYEHVSKELDLGEIRQGLWAMATAKADTYNEADIRRKYIELRVEFLKAEGRLNEQFEDEVMEATDEVEAFEAETEDESFRHTLIGVIIVLLIVFIIFALVGSQS